MTALRIFIVALLFLPALQKIGHSQTPVETNLPWNGYRYIEHIQGEYQSIIPTADSMLTGSDNLDPYIHNRTLTVTLPFEFAFNCMQYLAATKLRVGINGVVSLNRGLFPLTGSTADPIMTHSVGPYHLEPTAINGGHPAEYYHLLAPLWGEFTSQGVPSGGIYVKHETYPLSNLQVFTIEWKVRPYGISSHPPISFQIKFQRWISDPELPFSNFWIEYWYNPATNLNLPMPNATHPARYGAFVGMKYHGQGTGNPEMPNTQQSQNEGEDDDRLLIVTAENNFFPSTVPTAYTRLHTRARGSEPFTPDYFASYPITGTPSGPASPLFHYAFPGYAYRIKPIENDISGDSSNVAHYIMPVGEVYTLSGTFKNHGPFPVSDARVQARIYRDSTLLRTLDTIIGTIPAGGSATTDFPGPLDSAITSVPNLYRVVLIALLVNDENRSNDTVTFNLIVRDRSDVMPLQILSPQIGPGPLLTRYRADSLVPVRGVFLNSGTELMEYPRVGYRILDDAGNEEYRSEATLTAVWRPMQKDTVDFRPWQPTHTGVFRIEIFSIAGQDGIGENDTLNVLYAGQPWRSKQRAMLARLPGRFGIYPPYDLEIGAPGVLPHLPGMNEVYIDTATVMITLRNNGYLTIGSQNVEVTIRDSNNQIRYSQTRTVANIAANGGIYYQSFPTFADSPGLYRLEVNATLTWDSDQTNNTVSWPFIIDFTSSVEDEKDKIRKEREEAMTLSPNPARQEAWLQCDFVKHTNARITILDMQGREIKDAGEHRLGIQTFVRLDLQHLPSGVYMVRLVFRDGSAAVKRLTVVQ